MNDNRLVTTARALAATDHRAAGGTGEPPSDLVQKHAAALALECEKQSTPGVRQAPAMQPTNGTHPDDSPRRTTRDRSELRSLRGLDGRAHKLYSQGQRMADYTDSPAPFDMDTFGSALAAYATGRAQEYRAELRAMGEGTSTSGGILIPNSISANLIDLARSKARVFEAGAATLAMENENITIAKITADPTIYQVGENTAITASDTNFVGVSLYARKLAGLVKVSRELVEDAANIGPLLVQQLTTAMAQALDDRVLNGGTGFTGLAQNPALGETLSIGANLDYTKLLTAQNAIRILNGEANALIAHPTFFHELAILVEATTGAYLQPPPGLASIQMLPTTQIDDGMGIMGDYSKCLVGMRGDILVETTDVAAEAFAAHQVWFKVTLRCASNVTQNHFHRLSGVTF
jgi:HK97 family phage major capsid protein